MKKKILIILLIIMMLITGCGETNLTAKEAVRDYLEDYITLDSEVLKQLDEYVEQEDLNDKQKEVYKELLKKQYSSLTYTFTNESYQNDVAYITAKINVLDFATVQDDAAHYLQDNVSEFNSSDGVYEKEKFLDYKLEQMMKVTKTVSYDIEFKVIKGDKGWEVSQLSNDDLLKIHGVYKD